MYQTHHRVMYMSTEAFVAHKQAMALTHKFSKIDTNQHKLFKGIDTYYKETFTWYQCSECGVLGWIYKGSTENPIVYNLNQDLISCEENIIRDIIK